MTDDRLRAALERVEEAKAIVLDAAEIGWKSLGGEIVIFDGGMRPPDANFMFGVVIPWALTRFSRVDVAVTADGATVWIAPQSYGPETTDWNASGPDPMTALWLALGEAIGP